MKKFILLIGLSLLSITLIGCKSDKPKTKIKERIITAQIQVPIKHLYFSGTIQPIKTNSVLSPVDGRIEKLNFVYGQDVKKGQLLAIVNSLKLMDDFRTAVSSFLTKKTAYLTQAQTFEGSKVLYKAGVISESDYTTQKNSYENSVLDFFQEEYQLKKVLLKAGVSPESVEKLSISEISKIKLLFAKQFNHIKIYSPGSGVALFPLPDQSQSGGGDNSSDSSGAIIVGSKIREAQLILSIGDLEGFSIDMNINEVNINSIQKGMKATITGDAFPGISMNGLVTYVASQAQPNQGGSDSGGSVFKVSVNVPKINKDVLKVVHVGMTAKVDIPIRGQPHIMLPIDAVFRKNSQSMVTIVGANNVRNNVSVVTGNTTPTDVVIISGVSKGQKVVVRDKV
jgi:HlyD family secretion protein